MEVEDQEEVVMFQEDDGSSLTLTENSPTKLKVATGMQDEQFDGLFPYKTNDSKENLLRPALIEQSQLQQKRLINNHSS